MLGSFISRGLTAEEVEMEISISLVAGSDTTATAMRATLLSIVSNPRVYGKLVAEIDAALASKDISSPISEDEAKKLSYLQACIKEGIRRHPPITQLRERIVPPEGDYYQGQYIPPGTFIGLNAWGTQLSKVYGDDPEVFRPERWLLADEAQLKEMGRVHELIFGYGTTRCLGIPIAMMNLNKIFFEVSSPIWRSSDTDRNVAVQPLRYLDHQPPESVDESLLRDLLPKGL
jgi:cytochrome P450